MIQETQETQKLFLNHLTLNLSSNVKIAQCDTILMAKGQAFQDDNT